MKNGFILFVEDNPNDIELTKRAFQKHGIGRELVTVSSGTEAIDYLFGLGRFLGRDTSIKPAVILLDLKMPKLDGLQVLKRLRAEPLTALLPVVILTTSSEERDLVEGYRLGVNSYVRKPVNCEQFNDMLWQIGSYWLFVNEQPPHRRPE